MAGDTAPRDQNYKATILGVSSIGFADPTTIAVNPSTHAMLVESAGSNGTSVIVDGVSDTIRATVLDLTSSNPLTTAIVDASGNQITSFGGGTQYTDAAAAAAHPIGTGIIFNNAGTYNFVSAAQPLPITIASGNPTTITVTQGTATNLHTAATLDAETTKVIGTVRNADGSGNLWTSNSTTYTAKFGQDINLLGTLGTAFTTAGFVDIKGADGNVFVRNATAANFLANVTLQTQTDTVMVGGVNIKEINAVTPLMGNGTTGTGSQRVTIASDNTPYAVKIDQTTPGTTNLVALTSTTNKNSYGSYTAMTVTNLQSLASSATAGWQSARVDNQTSVKALDYEFFIKLTTANTAPANDKAAYVYLCPMITTDGGTTWLASDQGTTTLPTGTEGTTTIASPNNLKLLGVLSYTTQQMVMQGSFLLSNAYGQSMPDGFSLIIINFTGAALSTSCVVAYRALNITNS